MRVWRVGAGVMGAPTSVVTVTAFWKATFLAALPVWLAKLPLDCSNDDHNHAVKAAARSADKAVEELIDSIGERR